MSENSKLNPQIAELEIGTKKVRTITLYPLSLADQFKMSDLITNVIRDLVDEEGALKIKNAEDIEFVGYALELIKKNLCKILGFVTEDFKGVDPLKELTNLQVTELARIIFEVNYADAAKNALDLFERVMELFSPSKRSSQPSANDIPSSDSKISLEKATEKGD